MTFLWDLSQKESDRLCHGSKLESRPGKRVGWGSSPPWCSSSSQGAPSSHTLLLFLSQLSPSCSSLGPQFERHLL